MHDLRTPTSSVLHGSEAAIFIVKELIDDFNEFKSKCTEEEIDQQN